jgi:phage-related protein
MALISVTISGNAGPLKKTLEESEGRLGKFGSAATKIGVAAGAAFAAVGAAAVVVGKRLIDAAEQASTANARIEQIATSMNLFGEATQEVSNRLVKLAEKTALNTGVDQNAIKLTQAKLLTFVDLAKTADEVGGSFDRATQAAIDLAAAGFGEASQNAVQLGKALQDPIKGITALARSGVTFTEVEKERIQTLVDSNKLGEAQAMILEAIEKQVGGTAAATANASDKMRVAFSQLQERLGAALLPAFERLTQFMLETVFPALERLGEKVVPMIRDAFVSFSEFLTGRVIPVVRDRLLPVFSQIVSFIVEKVVPVVLDLWRRVFSGLAGIFDVLSQKMEANRENINKLVGFFRTLATFVVEKVAPILGKTLSVAFDVVAKSIGPVIDVVFRLMGAFATLGTFLLKTAGFILDVIGKMVNGVIDGVNLLIKALNLIPGIDIDPIGNITIKAPTLGAAPTVPTPGSTGRTGEDVRFGNIAPTVPGVGIIEPPTLPGSAGGGGGGGSGGGSRGGGDGVSILPIIPDYSNIYRPDDPRFADYTPGELARMEAGSVNITINTVSADANLPNLIVDALQQYNLTSGPIDVAIAV